MEKSRTSIGIRAYSPNLSKYLKRRDCQRFLAYAFQYALSMFPCLVKYRLFYLQIYIV